MALPCSSQCAGYYEGCHKTCAYWTAHRVVIHEENEKMKSYLKEHNETTTAVLRQFLSMSKCRKTVW